MLRKIINIRILFIVIVIITSINSIAFIIQGVIRSLHGYSALLDSITMNETTRPGIFFAESLDSFLIAIVFIIFSIGIYKLFVLKEDTNQGINIPSWVDVDNLSELKFLMWETIIITLIVLSVTDIIENLHHLGWETLILPSVILILTIGYFLVKKAKQ